MNKLFGENSKLLFMSYVFIVAAISLLMALVAAPGVHAEQSPGYTVTPGKNGLIGNQTYYVYLEPGEQLQYSYDLAYPAVSTTVFTVVVNGPSGYSSPPQTVAAGSAEGTTLNYTGPVATSAGVWRVRVTNPDGIWRWNVGAYNGATLIPGRTWATRYVHGQVGATANTNVNLWYVNDTGYIYRGTYQDFHGVTSEFTSNSIGISAPNSCTPLYQSTSNPAWVQPALNQNEPLGVINTACNGSMYRIFFAEPSSDLPESAPNWAGDVTQVLPTIKATVVDSLTYTHSGNPSNLSGVLTFRAQNYLSTARVLVDTNNNGSFTDAVDREIIKEVQSDGTQTVDFDGLDGFGATIAPGSTIRFKVVADRKGEIHFVNSDVEHRGGGIEVERLNGSAAGRYTLFYDDSQLNPNRCGARSTPVASPLAGISSQGGIHSWTRDGCVASGAGSVFASVPDLEAGSSWGNVRLIDDWTWDTNQITESLVFTARPQLSITKTAENTVYGLEQTVPYVITVKNTGTIPTFGNLTVVDTLPSNLTVQADSLPGSCTAQGQVITCILTLSLPVGGEAVLAVQATAKNAGSGIANIAIVYGGGDTSCTSATVLSETCTSTAIIDVTPGAPNTGAEQISLKNPGILLVLMLTIGTVAWRFVRRKVTR